VRQTTQDGLGRQHLHAGGGQLQRQRQPVEPPADFAEDPGIGPVEREPWLNGPRDRRLLAGGPALGLPAGLGTRRNRSSRCDGVVIAS
jgi:hypothetical protein